MATLKKLPDGNNNNGMAANPEDSKDLNPTLSCSKHDPQEKIVEPKKEKEVLILDLSQVPSKVASTQTQYDLQQHVLQDALARAHQLQQELVAKMYQEK